MFCIVDTKQSMAIVKSGFITASQANRWAKKNLPSEEVHLWKQDYSCKDYYKFRYFVKMR